MWKMLLVGSVGRVSNTLFADLPNRVNARIFVVLQVSHWTFYLQSAPDLLRCLPLVSGRVH